jgi:hypothetical protein
MRTNILIYIIKKHFYLEVFFYDILKDQYQLKCIVNDLYINHVNSVNLHQEI